MGSPGYWYPFSPVNGYYDPSSGFYADPIFGFQPGAQGDWTSWGPPGSSTYIPSWWMPPYWPGNLPMYESPEVNQDTGDVLPPNTTDPTTADRPAGSERSRYAGLGRIGGAAASRLPGLFSGGRSGATGGAAGGTTGGTTGENMGAWNFPITGTWPDLDISNPQSVIPALINYQNSYLPPGMAQQYASVFNSPYGRGSNLGSVNDIYSYLLGNGLAGQETLLNEDLFSTNQQQAQDMYSLGGLGANYLASLMGNQAGGYGNIQNLLGAGYEYLLSQGEPGRDLVQGTMQPSYNQWNDLTGMANTSLAYLMQNGMPNRSEITGRVGGWGSIGDTANSQLLPAYQHLMSQGLPGQVNFQDYILPSQQGTFQNLQGQNIENVNRIVAGQATPGIQDTATNTLNELIGSGGLTQDYIDAMYRQVYQPQSEKLLSNINQQLGGVANLGSGLSAELQRQGLSDFQDSLIRAGYGGLQSAIGQGLQAGQQGFGQAVTGAQLQNQLAQQSFGNAYDLFNAIPNQALNLMNQYGNYGQQATQNMFQGYNAPFAELQIPQMAAQQGQQGYNNLLNAYQTIPQVGLNIMNQAGNWAQGNYGNLANTANSLMNYGTAMDTSNFNRFNLQQLPLAMINQAANFGQQGVNQGMDYLFNMMNSGANAANLPASMYRSAFPAGAAENAANQQFWGSLIGSGISSLPDILALFGIG